LATMFGFIGGEGGITWVPGGNPPVWRGNHTTTSHDCLLLNSSHRVLPLPFFQHPAVV